MLIPSSLGLVLTTMPPARVKRSVRLWAVSGAAAGAIGPVLGGLLTSLSWRWIFLINLPIGITAIAVTWKMIPNVRHDRSNKMPDPDRPLRLRTPQPDCGAGPHPAAGRRAAAAPDERRSRRTARPPTPSPPSHHLHVADTIAAEGSLWIKSLLGVLEA